LYEWQALLWQKQKHRKRNLKTSKCKKGAFVFLLSDPYTEDLGMKFSTLLHDTCARERLMDPLVLCNSTPCYHLNAPQETIKIS